jgi:endonuclease-3 related protein
MPNLDDLFSTGCSALAEHFGQPAANFEGLSPFQAIVAVILDREVGARWSAALEGLEEAGLLSPERLADTDILEICDALREKGIPAMPQDVAPLQHLARWLVEHHGGRVDSLFNPDRSTDWLRGELASIGGISLTAADAIVLFALKRPSYPVDRATFRVLVRHGWLDPTATYDEARGLLIDQSTELGDLREEDASNLLIELAGSMEKLGRRYCRVAQPLCEGCPLESLLPEGGPRDVDG